MLPDSRRTFPHGPPLFGPGSLGLDSVDALQLVVALDKSFGLKITDPTSASQRCSVTSILWPARSVSCHGVVERAAVGRGTRVPIPNRDAAVDALAGCFFEF